MYVDAISQSKMYTILAGYLSVTGVYGWVWYALRGCWRVWRLVNLSVSCQRPLSSQGASRKSSGSRGCGREGDYTALLSNIVVDLLDIVLCTFFSVHFFPAKWQHCVVKEKSGPNRFNFYIQCIGDDIIIMLPRCQPIRSSCLTWHQPSCI